MRKFPCPVCHGSGILDTESVDGQTYVTLYCGWCKDGQMIVNSDEHKEYQLSKLFNSILKLGFVIEADGQDTGNYLYPEDRARFDRIIQLVRELWRLPLDNAEE